MTDAPSADRRLDELSEDYVRRLRAGESPDPEAYARDHPDLADRILEIFPVLALVEGVKTGPGAPPPGEIGRYRLGRLLGRGGMGSVFAAQDADGRRVALKLAHPHLADDPGFRARFLREVEAGRRVRHEGVARTLDAGLSEAGGREHPYLVLEYVEGRNLHQLLADAGSLSERLTREIGLRVAEALMAVHAAGIVHRDVKPENVVITADETVKLMDLGLAVLQEESVRLTRTGEFVGSLLYAAPEQLSGDPVDARTDLYGLGLLLYELVSGHHPYAPTPETSPSLLDLTTRSGPPAPPPNASPFLARVILRLLAPEASQRFETAEEVASILREGEQGSWWRARAERTIHVPVAREVGLVGRSAEMETLDRCLDGAAAGQAQVVHLLGEAGIGKSRLLAEWLERAQARRAGGLHALVAVHPSAAEAQGLTPFAASLRDALGDEDLEGRLAELLGPSRALAPALACLLRGASPSPGVEMLGPTARPGAFLRVLQGLADPGTLVVVFENLELASDESRAVFHHLAHALHDERIVLVGTQREAAGAPAREAGGADHRVRRITLPGLSDDEAGELLQEVLGEPLAREVDLQEIIHSADGNPHCLLEFARDIRQRRPNAFGPDAERIPIPSSLRALVERRLAELSETQRDLLGVAACLGDPFDPVVACEAMETPRLRGLQAFHEMDRRHRLVRAEGAAYHFRHHLVREVLHDEIPPALRAAYHTALADRLEATILASHAAADEVTGPDAYQLAHHLLQGEAPARAAPYAAQAALHLQMRGDSRRAVRLANRALALGDALGPRVRARVLAVRGIALLGHGEPREAMETLEEALAAGTALDDAYLLVRATASLGLAYRAAGDRNRAEELHRQAIAHAERFEAPAEEAMARGFLAQTLGELGRVDEAAAMGARAVALATRAKRPTLVGDVSLLLGPIEMDRGNLPRARVLLENALGIANIHGDVVSEINALVSLGKLAFVEGDMTASLDVLHRLLAHHERIGHLRLQAMTRVNLASCLLEVGDGESALQQARRALELASETGFEDIVVLARDAVGRGLAHEGRLAEAETAGREAHRRALALEQTALAARMALPVARVLAWTARGEEARAVTDQAAGWLDGQGHVRDEAALAATRAEVAEAAGDDAAALALWTEAHAAQERGGFRHATHTTGLRLGATLLRLGRREEGAAHLGRAQAVLQEGGARGSALLARAWCGVLDPAELPGVRVLLREQEDRLPRVERARVLAALARTHGGAGLREEARAAIEALVASARPEDREGMRALPIFGSGTT